MFFKNNFQPAYATANASFSRSERSARSESVMFSADNEEFNAFDSTPNYNSSNAQKRPQQRPQQKASGAQGYNVRTGEYGDLLKCGVVDLA